MMFDSLGIARVQGTACHGSFYVRRGNGSCSSSFRSLSGMQSLSGFDYETSTIASFSISKAECIRPDRRIQPNADLQKFSIQIVPFFISVGCHRRRTVMSTICQAHCLNAFDEYRRWFIHCRRLIENDVGCR